MIQISQLTDKISQLEISGVRVKDLDEMAAAVNARDCPVLVPEPLAFVSNIIVTRDTSGLPTVAAKTIQYTLSYTFLYAPIGSDRTLGLENYPKMVRKAFAILDAFIADDDMMSGTDSDEIVDITPIALTEFGPVPDPSGAMFVGCRIAFLVTEFIN
jgi:hypothetical protein